MKTTHVWLTWISPKQITHVLTTAIIMFFLASNGHVTQRTKSSRMNASLTRWGSKNFAEFFSSNRRIQADVQCCDAWMRSQENLQ